MSHLSNVRYGYFDALRGTAIILVVFAHIITVPDGINLFLRTFRMPLFFFVSGFFAYKPLDAWNKSKIMDIVIRKFKVQIIGASLFAFIYLIILYNACPSILYFFSTNPYWFTYALFRIFFTYIIIVCISKVFHFSQKTFWSILLSVTAFCMGVHLCSAIIIPRLSSFWYQIIFHGFSKHFFYQMPYFTLGLIARANMNKFENFVSNDFIKIGIFGSVITIWSLISLGYIPIEASDTGHGESPLSYPIATLSMILVVQFFYSIRYKFDQDTPLSKAIRLIGRRTLDIYFIHYFFSPDLHFLDPYLSTGNPTMLQLTIGIPISLIVSGLSLLVGQVIRMSPTLAEWLLGVKKKI